MLTYIASTALVMLWLSFIIHVTLRQNLEDAMDDSSTGEPDKPRAARISEFLKVDLLLLMTCYFLIIIMIRDMLSDRAPWPCQF